jgi:hypothetical protein
MRGMSPAREQLVRRRVASPQLRAKLLSVSENGVWKTPVLTFMEQPKAVPSSDVVVTRRTMAGVAAPTPVDAQAFRDSLNGYAGFSFSAIGDNGRFQYDLLTEAEAAGERMQAATYAATRAQAAEIHLTGFFDDLWSDIKDTANTIYDGATRIVLTIADTITVAVTTMVDKVKKVVEKVVDSVKDALDAVVGFFEQLKIAIEKVIQFLRALFNWGNIIKTHDILYGTIEASLTITANKLENATKFLDILARAKGASPGRLRARGAWATGPVRKASGTRRSPRAPTAWKASR